MSYILLRRQYFKLHILKNNLFGVIAKHEEEGQWRKEILCALCGKIFPNMSW